ncbi:MAG TPA: hypothetical protein VGG41_04830 [Solirubrobacteraceae bacterium]|jgi:hypothetical protein
MPDSPNSMLRSALAQLPVERLQRLVDALERDPDVALTVGSWRPQCPMVLAGFDPDNAAADAPERVFAAAWDAFATAEPRRRRRLPWCSTRVARRADVQCLLRCANATLAARHARRVRRLDRLGVGLFVVSGGAPPAR